MESFLEQARRHGKENQHDAWANRQAYRRHFSKPVIFLRNWSGNPDPCGCGCGGVEYSRADPTNWWQSLTPSLLWKTKFMLPVLWSLYKLLWTVCLILRARSLVILSARGFKAMVLANPLGNILGAILMPARLVVWLIASFIILFVWVVVLVGSIVLVPLYVVSLMLLVSLVLVIWLFAVLYITLHGFVFLVGGIASILYLSNPTIGIVLIALGVGIEYESKRRRERNHHEEVGQIIRIVEGAQSPNQAPTPQ